MKTSLKALLYLFLILSFTFYACDDSDNVIVVVDDKEEENDSAVDNSVQELTIFFINDQHGEIDNFAKVKYLVDKEKETRSTLLVCAGDIFSGNPIVDQYSQKGFPMIDLMNKTGFDIAVLGNHEFDYGIDVLKERMNEADFKWVCANVDMLNSGVPQPDAFSTLEVGELKISFIGLVETFGKEGAIIPSTHPWRVTELEFQRHYDVIGQYDDIKDQEGSDLVIALTHLGTSSDIRLAEENDFIDAVIGGHSHQVIEETINEKPVVQAGSNLYLLGKLKLEIENKKIIKSEVEMINLNDFDNEDVDLAKLIADYNNAPEFEEVVGFATNYLSRDEIGCFYTTALKDYYNVDASFQNGGGIRADIDQGDITALEIFNMDPFNNQSVIFTLTAKEVKDFFRETGAGLHISGIYFEQSGNTYTMYDEDGNIVNDNEEITIGINDYIPAVYDSYFPLEKATIQNLTTAESIINYLKEVNTIDYDNCDRYYQY